MRFLLCGRGAHAVHDPVELPLASPSASRAGGEASRVEVPDTPNARTAGAPARAFRGHGGGPPSPVGALEFAAVSPTGEQGTRWPRTDSSALLRDVSFSAQLKHQAAQQPQQLSDEAPLSAVAGFALPPVKGPALARPTRGALLPIGVNNQSSVASASPGVAVAAKGAQEGSKQTYQPNPSPSRPEAPQPQKKRPAQKKQVQWGTNVVAGLKLLSPMVRKPYSGIPHHALLGDDLPPASEVLRAAREAIEDDKDALPDDVVTFAVVSDSPGRYDRQ